MEIIKGKVVAGKRKGRTLGFPTANVDVGGELKTPAGIYAGYVKIDDERRKAALYVRGDNIIEAFIFDFAGDLYGREVEIALGKKIREKREFKSDEEAIGQIRKDVEEVKEYLPQRKVHPQDSKLHRPRNLLLPKLFSHAALERVKRRLLVWLSQAFCFF